MTTEVWNSGLAKDFITKNVLIVPHIGFLRIVQFRVYDLTQLSRWILTQVNCRICMVKLIRQFNVQLNREKTIATIKCNTCNANNFTSTKNHRLISFLERQLLPTDNYIVLMRDNVIDALGSNPYVYFE
jgi:hypothetical protein